MNKMQSQVAEFHRRMGQPVGHKALALPEDRKAVRIELIREEFIDELIPALEADDMVETADAAIDILYVTFGLLVRPFLLRLQGVPAAELDIATKSIAIPAHFTWAKGDKRREFLRVRRNATGGVELFSNQSSGVLTSTVWGDGLVDNPAGSTIARGDLVNFIALSDLLA